MTESDPVPAFRDFCLTRREEIAGLLRTRRVQTNEVGRSACLMPAFAHVAGLGHGPLGLIEIGASAGLNLPFDRYFYDYGDAGTAGDPASPVRLRCRVSGYRPPVDAIPPVSYRVGVDINVVDVRDEDAVAWLRALVWPEHAERAATLLAAVEVAREDPPRLVEGDGIEMLAELVAGVPAELPLCVFHSFVMNQVPREARQRYADTLAELSWQRPIFEVSFMGTPDGIGTAQIEMGRAVRGEWRRAVLAKAQAHGQAMEWVME
jgi:hypothetical protein